MIDRGALVQAFCKRFNAGVEPRLFRAPGRVNLIGEHTDYNDGFVLPMAIDCETVVAAAARTDRRVRVHTISLREEAEFDLDAAAPQGQGTWLAYVEGVARSLEAGGVRLTGADLVLDSDVPEGAGLSSSAALEISTGLALMTLSGQKVDLVSLALAGQRAEHEYVGTKSGIMDQYTAALAQKGCALLIDCRQLSAESVPLDFTRAQVVICDTGVKHDLASSEYNTRRSECEEGVRLLREELPNIKALRDVSVKDFEAHAAKLPETIRRRCRHVVHENERTLLAADALKQNDIKEAGRLMYESHESLRLDYEVSCAELDILVETAASVTGVYGARMTGGGFGGSTVNLVEPKRVPEFKEKIAQEYRRRVGREPTLYVTEACAGAEEVTPELRESA